MIFYSTNNDLEKATAEHAIFRGLPPDNGLYMPEELPALPASFWEGIDELSFQEIALEISKVFLGEEIETKDLKAIIDNAINFDAPLHTVEDDKVYCLELFHGPSMAFKDFGARFMAGVMSHFLGQKKKDIHILVATSGDTGGAVAQGFYNHPNIFVHILYPSGKVSDIQEKQLTTLSGNVKALEVEGTFDDCQALVKTAFLDPELRSKLDLASANSINIARLIPQAFYYVLTYARLKKLGKKIIFSVPSGNFGNLCAGVLATKLGMPNTSFIAATNLNKVVPVYLETGNYSPVSPSISTISNAMDVGNPSNFPRLSRLFDENIELLKRNVEGAFYTDEETQESMKEIYDRFSYVVCPHTAIAYRALKERGLAEDEIGVFLATAHYAKFLDEVSPVIGVSPEIPERLAKLKILEKKSIRQQGDYNSFKKYLLTQV